MAAINVVTSKTSFTQSRSGSQTLRNEVALDQATIPALCSPARRRPRRYGTREQGRQAAGLRARAAGRDLCGHLGVWLHPQVLTGPVVLKGDGTVVRCPTTSPAAPSVAGVEGTHSREPPSDTSPVCGGFRPLRKTDGRIAYHQVRGQR